MSWDLKITFAISLQKTAFNHLSTFCYISIFLDFFLLSLNTLENSLNIEKFFMISNIFFLKHSILNQSQKRLEDENIKNTWPYSTYYIDRNIEINEPPSKNINSHQISLMLNFKWKVLLLQETKCARSRAVF